MSNQTFALLGYLATVLVFAGLLAIVLLRPRMIIRPSVMFVGFYWLQVQASAAINHEFTFRTLDAPWIFLLLLHVFPLVVLSLVPLTFRCATEAAVARIAASIANEPIAGLIARFLLLLLLVYAILAAYLAQVPFNKTGLYALMFNPDQLDQYREHSMKLQENPVITYGFTILEKVIAPLAAGFATFIGYKAYRARNHLLVFVAILGVLLSGLPTLIYGARGPMTMVAMAAAFTLMTLLVSDGLRPLRLMPVAVAATVFAFVPISMLSMLKTNEISAHAFAYHSVNIVDRALGRGFVDNVWHLKRVERSGYYGLAGIEKVAAVLGIEPKDSLNEVGRSNSFSGNGLFEMQNAPTARKASPLVPVDTEIAKVNIRQTVSSGASFVVLNFTLFGFWSIPLSLLFVFAMDGLLLAYQRIPAASLAPVSGALSVPVLSLCFSFFTTVLASKGLLLIPSLGWLIGQKLPGEVRSNRMLVAESTEAKSSSPS